MAMYWLQSAQTDRGTCGQLPFQCMFSEWAQYYKGTPDIEFGHFIANPIRLGSDGPKSIDDIIYVHKMLCNRVSSLLDTFQLGVIQQQSWCHGRVAEEDIWVNPRDYKLIPLYRAVILMLDDYGPEAVKSPEGNLSMSQEAQRRTVLMIITGDDDGLSSPLTFDTIRSKSLPINRWDLNNFNTANAIRVPINIAVQFLADVQESELRAFPYLQCHTTDKEIRPRSQNASFGRISAEDWADEMFQEAEEGCDDSWELERAIDAVEDASSAQLYRKGFTGTSSDCVEYLVQLMETSVQ